MPGEEVTAHQETAQAGLKAEALEAHCGGFSHCTAVSQILAFCLLALDSAPQDQDARREVTRLNHWDEDWESILHAIP
jgi:hypothetical protein